MEAVVKYKYPYSNFINFSICYNYIYFNTKDKNFEAISTRNSLWWYNFREHVKYSKQHIDSIINRKYLKSEKVREIIVKNKFYEKHLIPFANKSKIGKYVRARVNTSVLLAKNLRGENDPDKYI